MKNLRLILIGNCLWLSGLSSCQKTEMVPVDKSLSTLKCDWPAYYSIDKSITDVSGKIVLRTKANQRKFYIQLDQMTVLVNPCNLGDSLKTEGTTVQVSGHLLTYPGIETANLEAVPFDISSIKKLVK